MWGTIADSFTKEGYISQGAYRKVVADVGGQAQVAAQKAWQAAALQHLSPGQIEKLERKKDQFSTASPLTELTSMIENFSLFFANTGKELGAESLAGSADALDKATQQLINQSKYALRAIKSALVVNSFNYNRIKENSSDSSDRTDQLGETKVNTHLALELLAKCEDLNDLKRKKKIPFTAYRVQLIKTLNELGVGDSGAVAKAVARVDLRAGQKGLGPAETFGAIVQQIVKGSAGLLVARDSHDGLPQLAFSNNLTLTSASRDALTTLSAWTMARAEVLPEDFDRALQLDGNTPRENQSAFDAQLVNEGHDMREQIFKESAAMVRDSYQLSDIEQMQGFRNQMVQVIGVGFQQFAQHYALFPPVEGAQSGQSHLHSELILSLIPGN